MLLSCHIILCRITPVPCITDMPNASHEAPSAFLPPFVVFPECLGSLLYILPRTRCLACVCKGACTASSRDQS